MLLIIFIILIISFLKTYFISINLNRQVFIKKIHSDNPLNWNNADFVKNITYLLMWSSFLSTVIKTLYLP